MGQHLIPNKHTPYSNKRGSPALVFFPRLYTLHPTPSTTQLSKDWLTYMVRDLVRITYIAMFSSSNYFQTFSQHCRDNPNYYHELTIILCGLSPLHLATHLYLRTPPCGAIPPKLRSLNAANMHFFDTKTHFSSKKLHICIFCCTFAAKFPNM